MNPANSAHGLVRFFLLQLICSSLSFFAAFPAFAQSAKNSKLDPLNATAYLETKEIIAGKSQQLNINVTLPPKYHAYADQFKVVVVEPAGFQTGVLNIDPIKEFYDKFSKKKRKGVEKEALLTTDLIPPSDIDKNYTSLKLELTYQACSETFCLFPKTKSLEIPIQIRWADPLPKIQSSTTPAASLFSITDIEGLFKQSLLLSFVLIFFAGVITSFTPCIFPMIPITLAILAQGSEKRSRLQNFLLSLLYVHGIATTYALLGLLAASTGSLFGASLGNPWVLGVICAIFFGMSLSLYGAFELQMPGFIRHWLGMNKNSSGFIGAYFSGLIAGVVASPCVGPVLVAILAYVATTQNKLLGFFLLFTYAMGLGLIFLFMGAFTEITRKLPRSGPWLEGIKFLMGSLMLGAFYYYLSLLISPRWHDGSLGLGLVILASLYGAFGGAPHNSYQRMRKGFMQSLLVIGIGYLCLSTFDLRPYLINHMVQPAQISMPIQWQSYSEESLKAAKDQGKPVIIDFFAEWCAACHELDKKTFTDSRIQQKGTSFVFLKFDATKNSDELEHLKEKYNIQGLPTVLFFNKDGQWLDQLTLTEFENADLFLERMNKAL